MEYSHFPVVFGMKVSAIECSMFGFDITHSSCRLCLLTNLLPKILGLGEMESLCCLVMEQVISTAQVTDPVA